MNIAQTPGNEQRLDGQRAPHTDSSIQTKPDGDALQNRLRRSVCRLYLEVAADKIDQTGALHAPQGLHLLEQLCSLLPVEDAEHLDSVQLTRLDVLCEASGRFELTYTRLLLSSVGKHTRGCVGYLHIPTKLAEGFSVISSPDECSHPIFKARSYFSTGDGVKHAASRHHTQHKAKVVRGRLSNRLVENMEK